MTSKLELKATKVNLFLSKTFWKFFFTAMRLKNKECVCFSVFWYIFNSTVGLHVLFSRYRYFIPRTTGKPYETSPDEFVSRPVRAIALCIPTVHHFRRKMHAHIREQKISFFSASKKNFHRHVIGFGDIPFISMVCNRAKSTKTLFSIQEATWVKPL